MTDDVLIDKIFECIQEGKDHSYPDSVVREDIKRLINNYFNELWDMKEEGIEEFWNNYWNEYYDNQQYDYD